MITGPKTSQILAKFSASGLGTFLQFAQHLVRHGLANGRDLRIMLQHFARKIERHVFRIDDAAHETQVWRQQLRVIGNVNPLHIKLLPASTFGIIEVEGPFRGHIEQNRIFVAPLGPVMDGQRRVL